MRAGRPRCAELFKLMLCDAYSSVQLPGNTCRSAGIYRQDMSDLEAEPPGTGPKLAYLRVADDIAARIASGELKPGARLLSERAMAEYFGVAFHTIRHAVAILRERGLVETIHGSGTYVMGPADPS